MAIQPLFRRLFLWILIKPPAQFDSYVTFTYTGGSNANAAKRQPKRPGTEGKARARKRWNVRKISKERRDLFTGIGDKKTKLRRARPAVWRTKRDEIFLKRDCQRLHAVSVLCKLATFEFQVQIFKWNTCSNSRCTYKTDAPSRLSLSLSLPLALSPTTMSNGGREHECIMHAYIVIYPMDRLVLSFCYEFSERFSHAKTESVRILFELKNIVIRRSTFVNKPVLIRGASLCIGVGRDKCDFY